MNPERDDITKRVRKDREGVLGISTPIFRSQGDRGAGGRDQQRRPSEKDQKGRRKVRRLMFWPSNAAGGARKGTR